MPVSIQSIAENMTPQTERNVFAWGGGSALVAALALYYFKGDSKLFKWISWIIAGGGVFALCCGIAGGKSDSSPAVSTESSTTSDKDPFALRKKYLTECDKMSSADLIKSLKDGKNNTELRLAAAEKLIMRDKIKELQKAIAGDDFGNGGTEAQNKEVLEEIKGMLVPVTHWTRFFRLGPW